MVVAPLHVVQHLWVPAICMLFSTFCLPIFTSISTAANFWLTRKVSQFLQGHLQTAMQILITLDLVNAWLGVSFPKNLNDLRVSTKVTLWLLSMKSP